MPLLKGTAGALDLVLEEGAIFNPTFLHLEDDATDENGTPEAFDAGTLAYLTVRDEIGGTVLFQLGPSADALDGTTEVTAATGTIACSLAPLDTIGLVFPSDGSPGVWDLVIFPGGDETLAYRLLEGTVTYSKRVSVRPEVGS